MIPLFTHPFNMIVSGQTGCGKTEWCKRLIDNLDQMIQPQIEKVIWYYSCYQQWYSKYADKVEFSQGLPNPESFDGQQRILCILDDQMSEIDESYQNMFTKFSHHKNLSNIFICQNLFFKGKFHRNLSLNSHYFVLFNNYRDLSQLGVLNKQMFPGRPKFLQEAMQDATKKDSYGYLVLDLRPTSKYRVKTLVFPGEYTEIYY